MNPVNVRYLCAAGTLDDIVWPAVKRKLENLGRALDGAATKLGAEDTDHGGGGGAEDEEGGAASAPPDESVMSTLMVYYASNPSKVCYGPTPTPTSPGARCNSVDPRLMKMRAYE